MDKNFKIDDWIFYEFELYQVQNIQDSMITVTDGYMSTCSFNNIVKCFPVTMIIKLISDEFNTYYENFKKINLKGLDLSSIHNYLIWLWVSCCENCNSNYTIQEYYNKLKSFEKEVLDECERVKNTKVNNINIFK